MNKVNNNPKPTSNEESIIGIPGYYFIMDGILYYEFITVGGMCRRKMKGIEPSDIHSLPTSTDYDFI